MCFCLARVIVIGTRDYLKNVLKGNHLYWFVNHVLHMNVFV